MNADAKLLLDQLLALPQAVRVEFLIRLDESVPATDDAEVEAAWSDVIQTRLEEIDSGKVKLIPAEEVHRRFFGFIEDDK